MAAFRKISVSYWSDSFVGELTPEQKYFYLYLMTNDKTTQCGIYETSIRKICFDTGYNSETVQKLIDFFQEKNKIRWSKSTNEVALLNWVKFNDSNSPKVMACVEKELKQVKNRVFIEYLYSIDTHPHEGEEKEKEKNKADFNQILLPYANDLGPEYVNFAMYWMEQDKKGRERWKQEKFFDIKRRITTWMNNARKFAPNKPQQQLGKLQQNMISLKNVHDELTEQIENGTFINPYK